MLDVTTPQKKLRWIYQIYSYFYFLTEPFEQKAKRRGIELALINPTDKILEVGVGEGANFLELVSKVSADTVVYGIDFSSHMVEKTRSKLKSNNLKNFDLQIADAVKLPFADEAFDLVYSSYMLDLIPFEKLPTILREFYRVLKPNGRLVLVNLSKKDEKKVLYEFIYPLCPLVFGGCRPILMSKLVAYTGFQSFQREYISLPVPSEIILGRKGQ